MVGSNGLPTAGSNEAMTPILAGRVQTRLLLMLTLGLPLALCFGFGMGNLAGALILLGLALGIGLLLDPLYTRYQQRRWDGDWPVLLMVVAGFLEGGVLWLLLQVIIHWQMPFFRGLFTVTHSQFGLMYGTIWLLMLLANLGILPIFSPYRRFKGGKFWD